MSRRPMEPVLWLAFSAGGVVAALVLPILLLLFGLAIPLGWLSTPDYGHLYAVVHNPLIRLALLAVCVLALVHAAHRLRHTVVHGLRLGHLAGLIAALCYGGALVGSVAAAAVLFA